MIYVIAAIHVIVCLFLIIVVLLQSGQAADLAGAFGGMGSQTVFGPRGSTSALSKATTWAAIIFMVSSLTLAIMGSKRAAGTTGSVLDNRVTTSPAPAKTQPKPAQKPAPAPAPAAPKK